MYRRPGATVCAISPTAPSLPREVAARSDNEPRRGGDQPAYHVAVPGAGVGGGRIDEMRAMREGFAVAGMVVDHRVSAGDVSAHGKFAQRDDNHLWAIAASMAEWE